MHYIREKDVVFFLISFPLAMELVFLSCFSLYVFLFEKGEEEEEKGEIYYMYTIEVCV